MSRPLLELFVVFGRLGLLGFGGPAAHIALMREEVVVRRRWMDDRRFVDLVAASNLVPGPTSTELAGHLGYVRAGVPGLVVAWASFILPAAAVVGGVAVAYVHYGRTSIAGDVLWGLKPVVIAIVAAAVVALARTAAGSLIGALVAAGAVVAFLLGVDELLILVVGGAFVAAARSTARGAPAVWLAPLALAADVDLGRLALVFLKVGALLYGSGYVLVAFLQRDLVEGLGWLTERELLDAVAIGQATPGPLFTTATFVGYLLSGWTGAAIATAAIFLPSLVFVAVSGPLLRRVEGSPAARAVLDGVGAASVGLMAGAVVVLADGAFPDAVAAVLGLAALAAIVWRRVSPLWLVAAGAAAGLVRAAVV